MEATVEGRKYVQGRCCALIVAAVVAALGGGAAVAAEEGCELAARYEALADTARAEHREDDAYEFLARAAESCPRYGYWQRFGELAARLGDPERDARAAEAFVNARNLAATPAEEARAIAAYAELLYHSGDRSRGLDLVLEARNLDPDNRAVLELVELMQSETAVLTEEDVRRGRAAVVFAPMPKRKTAPGASDTTPAPSTDDERKVNVPLNFVYGATELDATSKSNVATLSRTLASFETAQNFVFEGHADARGSAEYNRDLSLRRAAAVRDLVIAEQPALAGRIFVVGKGEDEPRALGSLESDHLANRRLEVSFP
jgi:outer membrane protein OmpA-like peptidoglycan-associated protein